MGGYELHEIVKGITQILSVESEYHKCTYIMLKDLKTLYNYWDFGKVVYKDNLSDDAYVFIQYHEEPFDSVSYYYPFISDADLLVRAYLSKQGFYSDTDYEINGVVPAKGLKYVAVAHRFIRDAQLVIEIADIDNMAKNVNLPSLIPTDPMLMYGKDVLEITAQLVLQRVFSGFSFVEAEYIIRDYYRVGTESYAKYVEDIKDAYRRIFQPYRVKYNPVTKQYLVE